MRNSIGLCSVVASGPAPLFSSATKSSRTRSRSSGCTKSRKLLQPEASTLLPWPSSRFRRPEYQMAPAAMSQSTMPARVARMTRRRRSRSVSSASSTARSPPLPSASPLLFPSRSSAPARARAGLAGLTELARAPADGYTLLALAMPTAALAAFRPQDFSGVGQVVSVESVLVAHRSTAARDVAGLVAMLKAEPGHYRFASGGNGTQTNLLAELFNRQAGIEASAVFHPDSWRAVAELARGKAQYMFVPWPPALQHINSGALRPLAVTGTKRLERLKRTPTMVEAGFPGFVIRDWLGFVVRAGTSRVIIERLNTELNRAMA